MTKQSLKKTIVLSILLTALVGCATLMTKEFANLYGDSQTQNRMVSHSTAEGVNFLNDVQPILESKCIVCHGCYDAPCQLKLSSPEGIDRGATEARVYQGSRLTAAEPTRLFLDQQSTEAWRENGFYSVLNERQQSTEANFDAGVMARLLAMKHAEPAYKNSILPDSIPLDINHETQCPQDFELDDYIKKYPQLGMPYGLPAIAPEEHQVLQKWLSSGAKMSSAAPLGNEYVERVDKWEAMLNGDSLKEQMVGRYLYEHWFIAHMYFDDLPAGEFFRVMRSRTPPGEPIDIIATRRPYDDPGVSRVYYRLWREKGSILDKTHLPYALNDQRLNTYKEWFLDDPYTVTKLASYEAKIASNPFKSFEQIPVAARYKFLLEEAQFTIMNFIKGPVCRGRISLNVINDHFWVFFVEPEQDMFVESDTFYDNQEDNLALPAAAKSNSFVPLQWSKYSKAQNAYMNSKAKRMNKLYPKGEHLEVTSVWDGDGKNTNASLTVFRHLDTATVTKGLVGKPPQTSWLIDYALLERIHYLLVAGFDVYGNVGHQLNTRLYMDFLRIEGEFNFLAMLPPSVRKTELSDWYQGLSAGQKKELLEPYRLFSQPAKIDYKTSEPKLELYNLLKQRLQAVLPSHHRLDQAAVPKAHQVALMTLDGFVGPSVKHLPQVVFLTVESNGKQYQYTILHNNEHSNISSLFFEKKNRLPELDSITVANGFIGAYPGVFMKVNEASLNEFTEQLRASDSEKAYARLLDNYGIRRTSPEFWPHSDRVHKYYKALRPYDSGLLDYNRLENR